MHAESSPSPWISVKGVDPLLATNVAVGVVVVVMEVEGDMEAFPHL